ncbi:hypothetical protein CES85_1647 [Ochrobactrum quorumnocens]|uniref:Uncharacterized protein n=1 Tax=Ochrobactrum quorumnocens TaxID=271865 RepID=A0A248ULQ4_9HYPH|nr:hypothetical protein [[Ochrobactrum] quorumnocens]ASV87311.1 hypothetical protein CES85_1647 [[Ochrobactrum] quorumnocens]
MAVFTQDGRVALAKALYDMTLFLAVGEGLPEWDDQPRPTTPEEQAAQDAVWSVLSNLENPVGVTRTRDKYFVVPDPDGDIVMADGAKFSQSTEPTGFVFLRFQLDLDDASNNTLRETGMFVGTKLAEGVPGGKMFIPVADVVDLGKMIEVDRFSPIIRDGSIGQTFTFIMTM